uniref:Uncharacterized protein n=1 Tax=Oryza rufipogon TaxID=4529 RepID=A0A0E0NS95_ORYRU
MAAEDKRSCANPIIIYQSQASAYRQRRAFARARARQTAAASPRKPPWTVDRDREGDDRLLLLLLRCAGGLVPF